MNAVVTTAGGTWLVDLETEELVVRVDEPAVSQEVEVDLPLLVATAAAGATVVAVVSRRPPLVVSHDAGRTWREAGGGLPAGTAVAVDVNAPDTMLYAARNRLFLSHDGGRFWQALALELPEILAVAFA
jgi:pseudouridine-5'-phosphate glycosidase